MVVTIKHTFTNPTADDGDPNLTGPNEWNADHTINGLSGSSLATLADIAALKLDDTAAPDDNTDRNVSVSAHGLTPKLPNDAALFFNGVGGYTAPAGGSAVAAPVLVAASSAHGSTSYERAVAAVSGGSVCGESSNEVAINACF